MSRTAANVPRFFIMVVVVISLKKWIILQNCSCKRRRNPQRSQMLNVSIHVITALLLKNDYVVNSSDILKDQLQHFLKFSVYIRHCCPQLKKHNTLGDWFRQICWGRNVDQIWEDVNHKDTRFQQERGTKFGRSYFSCLINATLNNRVPLFLHFFLLSFCKSRSHVLLKHKEWYIIS